MFVASARTYFRCKFNIDDATQSDIVAGLESIVADPHAPAEGIVFVKADGATSIDIQSVVGSTVEQSATLDTALADATEITLEFYWDGVDRVYYGANGTPQGFLDLSDSTDLTTRETTPTFGVQAGEAAVKVASLDYLFAASQRD